MSNKTVGVIGWTLLMLIAGIVIGCMMLDNASVPAPFDRLVQIRDRSLSLISKCEDTLPRDQHCELVLSVKAVSYE